MPRKNNRSKNWQGGSTRAWRKTRAQILSRDPVCQLGYPGCSVVATEAHHTVGRGVTGDDIRYLVGACKSCNRSAGDPTRTTPRAQPKNWW